jgi:hypothetical protein
VRCPTVSVAHTALLHYLCTITTAHDTLQVCALHEDFHYDSFTVNLVEVLELPTAAPTEPAVLPVPDVPVADAPAPPGKKNGASTAAAAGISTVLFTAAALLAVL